MGDRMSKKIKIGILEDDPHMRGYLTTVLIQEKDIDIGFCEPTISKAKAAFESLSAVDLCLVDLQLPDGNGVEFVQYINQQSDCKSLILTVLGDRVSVLAALEAGAQGYILKDSAPRQIMQHIKDVMSGANPISPQVATHLLKIFNQHVQDTGDQNEPSILTERETEILTLFAKGLSYKEAARALEISNHTIGDYVKSIYGKLSVHSRNEAVFEALQMGWINL